MRTSQKLTSSRTSYSQPMQHVNHYVSPTYQILNNDSTDHYFTLESTPTIDHSTKASPSPPSVSSNKSPFSPQDSHSYASDLYQPSDITYGSPMSGSSDVEDENKLLHALWVLRNELLGPESDTDDSGTFNGVANQPSSFARYNRVLEMAPHMDLKQLLGACAEIVAETDIVSLPDKQVAISAAEALMEIVEKMVSISGEPSQRLGAYMLEGLRARLLSSGSIICKKLKCKEPTSSELMSYMGVLYQICPYYKFAYMSSNVIIAEAMENETKIHIVDFQIAQGSQWVSLIQAVARRPNGPPCIRITGVDDSESAHARGGGLELVGRKLSHVAESCGVPFEFNGVAKSESEIELEHLQIRYDEALAVNFPYILHHVPDENAGPTNHRDRLLRLVKSLSPKVVTLVEVESNTNTSVFYNRFCEAFDYYTAMFESIDAARPREDAVRISAEEHCVAKDVVNIIACEGVDRVERHEIFTKWRVRLAAAGFSPLKLSPNVANAVGNMLKEYSSNYRLADFGNGALYLGWKNRALVTTSAWR